MFLHVKCVCACSQHTYSDRSLSQTSCDTYTMCMEGVPHPEDYVRYNVVGSRTAKRRALQNSLSVSQSYPFIPCIVVTAAFGLENL